uniref:Serine/arginine repetitive matrix protein 1 n=1 Tax=Anopheles farauti TaxID=69004 RepID=A0A182QNJ4_9DIPT
MMFTGTNQQQDSRFSDKEKKLLKQMKFSDNLNKRVDMSKVKLDVLRPWISQKITDMLNIEDDVIVEFVYNQLEEEKFPCPKKMQINLTGFLNGKNARLFMEDLWSLLLSAQDSDTGIPAEFIQAKKEEILKREEEARLQEDGGGRDNRARSHTRDKDDVGGGGGKQKQGKSTVRQMYKPEPEDYIDEEEKMIEEFVEADVPKEPKKVPTAAVAVLPAPVVPEEAQNKSEGKASDGSEKGTKEHSSSSRRKSTERGNGNSAALSKLQSKLMNMAEGKKGSANKKSPSRSSAESRSRSRSRTVPKEGKTKKSASRSRSPSKSSDSENEKKAKSGATGGTTGTTSGTKKRNGRSSRSSRSRTRSRNRRDTSRSRSGSSRSSSPRGRKKDDFEIQKKENKVPVRHAVVWTAMGDAMGEGMEVVDAIEDRCHVAVVVTMVHPEDAVVGQGHGQEIGPARDHAIAPDHPDDDRDLLDAKVDAEIHVIAVAMAAVVLHLVDHARVEGQQRYSGGGRRGSSRERDGGGRGRDSGSAASNNKWRRSDEPPQQRNRQEMGPPASNRYDDRERNHRDSNVGNRSGGRRSNSVEMQHDRLKGSQGAPARSGARKASQSPAGSSGSRRSVTRTSNARDSSEAFDEGGAGGSAPERHRTSSERLRADKPTIKGGSVEKDGRPATNLAPSPAKKYSDIAVVTRRSKDRQGTRAEQASKVPEEETKKGGDAVARKKRKLSKRSKPESKTRGKHRRRSSSSSSSSSEGEEEEEDDQEEEKSRGKDRRTGEQQSLPKKSDMVVDGSDSRRKQQSAAAEQHAGKRRKHPSTSEPIVTKANEKGTIAQESAKSVGNTNNSNLNSGKGKTVLAKTAPVPEPAERSCTSSSSEDSDAERQRKKRRKEKKRQRNASPDDDGGSVSSGSKRSSKKHKKHRKHAKKHKKHKKHKKSGKGNKYRSSSSSSDEAEDVGGRGKKGPVLGGSGPVVINDDLEKQLRERALKSMKKQQSISD